MEQTRREVIKMAIAAGALAVLPATAAAAAAPKKKVGVEVLVRTPGAKIEWFDISWERLLPGDLVKFSDIDKLFILQSKAYNRASDGAQTVDADEIPKGSLGTFRVSDELLRIWMRDPSRKIEIPTRNRSCSCGGEDYWIPYRMEDLKDGQQFRLANPRPNSKIPHILPYTLFTL